MPSANFPYYLFNQYSNDFGFPICQTDADCEKYFANSSCQHLNAFYNGKNGNETKMCLGHSDIWIDHVYNAITHAQHYVDITTFALP